MAFSIPKAKRCKFYAFFEIFFEFIIWLFCRYGAKGWW